MAKRDAGRAMQELSMGAGGRAEDAAREINPAEFNAPAFQQMRMEIGSQLPQTTEGTIPEIQGIPPEAIEAARQLLAAEGGRGQASPAPVNTVTPEATTNTPVIPEQNVMGQPVDLNPLYYPEAKPETPVAAPVVPVQTLRETIGTVTEQKPQQRVVADDNLIIDTPEGPRTWKEINGERMLKSKFSKEQVALLAKEQVVNSQRAILEAAAGSDYARNLVEALQAGHTEDVAIKIATAAARAAGKSIPTDAPVVPEAEPEFPSDQDPEFASKYAKFLQFHTEKAVSPLRQEIKSLRDEGAAKIAEQTQAERVRTTVTAGNDRLFEALVDPHLPQNMTAGDRAIVAQYLMAVGKDSLVDVDPATYTSKQLRPAEVAYLAEKAFPNGALPDAIASRLSGYIPSQHQSPPTNGSVNGNGHAPVAPNWAALTPMQQTAMARQLAMNESAIIQMRQQQGLGAYGQPPGIPQEPVLNAGPNPSAINVTSTPLGGQSRAENRIAQVMGGIGYKE